MDVSEERKLVTPGRERFSSNENGRALIAVELKLRGQARSRDDADVGFVNYVLDRYYSQWRSDGEGGGRGGRKEGRRIIWSSSRGVSER
jgi:hypothetical protein